jgi:hypothetical protein
VERVLDRTGKVRASFWLVLCLFALISPSFASSEHWGKGYDGKQPAVQSAAGLAVTAARPDGPHGDPIAAQNPRGFIPPDQFSPEYSGEDYRSLQIIEVSNFNPRAPPRQ